jgi:hypothetical protein
MTFDKIGFKKADIISLCGTMAESDNFILKG